MKHKAIIMILITVFLLTAAGSFYVYKVNDDKKTVFLPLDEFLIDIFVPQSQEQNVFLKIKLTLEIEQKKDLDAVVFQMPKIRDAVNYYIKDLSADDLTGSGGIYYLRQELLLRINKIMFPIVVKNVLFDEIVRG